MMLQMNSFWGIFLLKVVLHLTIYLIKISLLEPCKFYISLLMGCYIGLRSKRPSLFYRTCATTSHQDRIEVQSLLWARPCLVNHNSSLVDVKYIYVCIYTYTYDLVCQDSDHCVIYRNLQTLCASTFHVIPSDEGNNRVAGSILFFH